MLQLAAVELEGGRVDDELLPARGFEAVDFGQQLAALLAVAGFCAADVEDEAADGEEEEGEQQEDGFQLPDLQGVFFLLALQVEVGELQGYVFAEGFLQDVVVVYFGLYAVVAAGVDFVHGQGRAGLSEAFVAVVEDFVEFLPEVGVCLLFYGSLQRAGGGQGGGGVPGGEDFGQQQPGFCFFGGDAQLAVEVDAFLGVLLCPRVLLQVSVEDGEVGVGGCYVEECLFLQQQVEAGIVAGFGFVGVGELVVGPSHIDVYDAGAFVFDLFFFEFFEHALVVVEGCGVALDDQEDAAEAGEHAAAAFVMADCLVDVEGVGKVAGGQDVVFAVDVYVADVAFDVGLQQGVAGGFGEAVGFEVGLHGGRVGALQPVEVAAALEGLVHLQGLAGRFGEAVVVVEAAPGGVGVLEVVEGVVFVEGAEAVFEGLLCILPHGLQLCFFGLCGGQGGGAGP